MEGEECATFAEAARRLGIMESGEMYERWMQDAAAETPSLKGLQQYFATMLYYSQPPNPQHLFDMFLDEMYPPPLCPAGQEPLSREFRKDVVMRNLEFFFESMGTTSR